MTWLKRLAAVFAALLLVAVFLWTSSQSVRGFVTGLIWDRDSTLDCTGGVRGDRISLSDEMIESEADPLIFASGGCRLQIVDVSLSAPTAIRATGNAYITVEGGRIEGRDVALEVSGRAVVRLIDTEVEGPIEVSGEGVVEREPER